MTPAYMCVRVNQCVCSVCVCVFSVYLSRCLSMEERQRKSSITFTSEQLVPHRYSFMFSSSSLSSSSISASSPNSSSSSSSLLFLLLLSPFPILLYFLFLRPPFPFSIELNHSPLDFLAWSGVTDEIGQRTFVFKQDRVVCLFLILVLYIMPQILMTCISFHQ